jgi:hypothetical protein
MKLLTESNNVAKSSNGGEYATGFKLNALINGYYQVTVDRAFQSDYEGSYLHDWYISADSEDSAEQVVLSNSQEFARQVNNPVGLSFAELPFEVRQYIHKLPE